MAEVQSGQVVRRRRRKSSRKKAASWPEYWRSSEFARHLFIGMCLVGVAYSGKVLYDTRQATINYDALWLRANESEVRYMLGTPDATEEGGNVYRYSERGRELAVRFSPEGLTNSISCAPAAAGPSTCNRVRGIGIGTTENVVWLKLGLPTRQTFSGNEKTIHYDGMGLSFRLSLFKVREIEVREGGNFMGYFPRAVWAMIP